MKKTILAITIITFVIASCNNSGKKSADKSVPSDTTNTKQPLSDTSNKNSGNISTSVKSLIGVYLEMKNALANDNAKDAATAGNEFVETLNKVDVSSIQADKKQVWTDIAADAKEMAEHIGKSAGKIAHQREHFEMLSKDMYDLVKAFGAGQSLYKDFCPMYNDGKGAFWLSELKEIKNPYMGQDMGECGKVQEEIK